MRLSDLPIVDDRGLRALLPFRSAVVALEAALRDGSAPGLSPSRQVATVPQGELLGETASTTRYVGHRLTTLAPRNEHVGVPVEQGVYALFDALTLSPRALVDATALLRWRVPTVSATVVRHVTARLPLRVVVIGTGPLAYLHLEAVAAVRTVAEVTVAGRDRDRAERLAAWARTNGVPARVVAGSDLPDDLERPVSDADLVICATSSTHPVFRSRWLTVPSLVIAVGSRNPRHREVDDDLVRGGTVLVETRAAALARSGDLLVPMARQKVGPDVVAGDLAELVNGWVEVPDDRPVLFTGVGEPWADLALAAAAFDQLLDTAGRPAPA